MGDSKRRRQSPLPSTSRKTDAELLLEHGITKECRVCVTRLAKFLTNQNTTRSDLQPEPQKKEFKVHYGRHFLQEIADYAYRSKPDHNPAVDVNHLYSIYITSQFSALDRSRFNSILQAYQNRCQEEFNRRRADLIAKKVAAVAAKKRAAMKKRKIHYKGSYIIVSNDIGEEAKRALQDGRRSRVVLERIFVDGPTQTSEPSEQMDDEPSVVDGPTQTSEPSEQMDDEPSVVSGPPSPATDDSELTVTESNIPQSPSNAGDPNDELKDREDPQEVTTKLIWDLIEKTSADLESSGLCAFPDDDDDDDEEEEEEEMEEEETNSPIPDNNTDDSTIQDHNTDYSDDTIESPMEVEFGSGASPDFSNVLQISRRVETFEVDSEETRQGDEDFVTQSRSSYTCDTDQSNSGLPTENGDVKNHCHHNSSSGDEANCVIKQPIKSKSLMVLPVKLCK